MKKIGLLLLSISFLLFACNADDEEKEITKNVCDIELDCTTADMSAYENFDDENHVFLEANFNKVNTFLDDKEFSGIIYFGYSTCPWCVEALPIMNEVAKEMGLSIYYVDKKSEINQENPDWEQTTTEYLDAAYGLNKDGEGTPRIYVPEVIVVKGGEVLEHHMGTLKTHDATERKMNEGEQEELKGIYEEMFSNLK